MSDATGGLMERSEAIAKDPLVSDVLIDLRWHQRRQLRLLPDWLVETVFEDGFMASKKPKLPEKDKAENSMVEWGLRIPAQRIEENSVRAKLDRFADNVRQRELYGFLNANWHLSDKPIDHPLQAIMNEAHEASKHPPNTDTVDDALLGYVLLVTWADWIAGDYLDPRVEQHVKKN
jgi:hypothetical protein